MAYQQIRIHLPYWLKRQALADALAQSKGNLSTWLSGSRSISDADLDRIAAFMHAISEHAEQVADQIYGLKVSDKEEMHPDNDQEWAQAQLEQIKFFFKKISEKT